MTPNTLHHWNTTIWIVDIIFYFLFAIALFNLARKAGHNKIAWFTFIPVLGWILKLILIKKSGWWVLILLVPIADIVFAIIWHVKLLKAFGKHGAWVLMWIFLAPVYVILWLVWSFSEKTQYVIGKSPFVESGTVGFDR